MDVFINKEGLALREHGYEFHVWNRRLSQHDTETTVNVNHVVKIQENYISNLDVYTIKEPIGRD